LKRFKQKKRLFTNGMLAFPSLAVICFAGMLLLPFVRGAMDSLINSGENDKPPDKVAMQPFKLLYFAWMLFKLSKKW